MLSCFPFHTLLDGMGAGAGAVLTFFPSSLAADRSTFDVGRVLIDVLESVDGPNIRSLRPFHTDGPLMISLCFVWRNRKLMALGKRMV